MNMNADIKAIITWCSTYFEYQQTQPQEKTIQYEIPYKPWEVVGIDISFVK